MAKPYGNLHIRSQVAQDKQRIQNVAVKTAVAGAAKIVLWGLIITNADVAAQTVTIQDGATTYNVVKVPAGTTLPITNLGVGFDDLEITPSSANLDIAVFYSS